MNMRHALLLLPALLCGTAYAQDPPEVDAYLQELARVEAAPQPQSLEPLWQRAGAAQDAIMKIGGVQGADSDMAWLETLTPEEFAAFKQRLRGFAVSRDGAIYAQPDPAFLSDLAQSHGLLVDQKFFQLQQQFWGKNLFPVYMQSHGDVSGCVVYGQDILIELYESWRTFAAKNKGAYDAATQQVLKDIESTIGLGTCACGDAASVGKELQRFIWRYPQSPAAPDARVRLREIQTGKMKLPVGCR